ncbi:MAG: Thioredoxin-disulfide reductase [Marmoricola sp.]|nr:Thioredoxin-disulfide reductase [Marmoricola sp.]
MAAPTVERDSDGFILTGPDLSADAFSALGRLPLALETSLGSPRSRGLRHGSVQRVASVVGEGSIAIQLVHRLRGVSPIDVRHRGAVRDSRRRASAHVPLSRLRVGSHNRWALRAMEAR